MRVITDRKIQFVGEEHSFFMDKFKAKMATKYGGDEDGEDGSIHATPATEADKQQMIQQWAGDKGGKSSKKDARRTNRANRREARRERREERKMKKDARKLETKKDKEGKEVHADAVPTITRDSLGNFIKRKADGTLEKIAKALLVVVNSKTGATSPLASNFSNFSANELIVDKTDIANGKPLKMSTNPISNAPVAEQHYSDDEVIETENGNVYKKSDVAGEGDSTKGGMSKGLKIGLIVGGSILIIVAGVLIYKHKRK